MDRLVEFAGNHPVLTAATNTATGTDIAGVLNSRPNTTYALDFFANAAPDTSGYGEGQYYLGSTNLTTGADSSSYMVPVNRGK